MAQYVKVKDDPSFVKDPDKNAILNTNVNDLNAYKKRKQRERVLDDLQEEMHEIRSALKEIKELLRNDNS